jgi:hypothetical protein
MFRQKLDFDTTRMYSKLLTTKLTSFISMQSKNLHEEFSFQRSRALTIQLQSCDTNSLEVLNCMEKVVCRSAASPINEFTSLKRPVEDTT